MVTKFSAILVCATSACTTIGCINTEPSSTPYGVEVLSLTSKDPITGGGRYALRSVSFPALQSIDPLHDNDFRFIAESVVDVDALSKISDPNQLSATARAEPSYVPRLRYLDGTLVPRDLVSLQVMSAYGALRDAADAIPAVTGMPSAAILPANGLQVWIKPSFRQGALTARMESNAFYLPYTDSFGLVDFSSLERRPVGALIPIITHEFGHHLFHRSFTQTDGVCDGTGTDGNYPGRFANDVSIAGINEGFADWISFIITGTTNVLFDAFSDSVGRPATRAIDVRTAVVVRFDYQTLSLCGSSYYCLGTLFARSLFEAFVARGGNPNDRTQRMLASRNVFAAMITAPQNMRTRVWVRPKEPCGPNSVFDPSVLAGFLGGFVAGLPATDRATVCERFIVNFGAEGFAAEFRGACL
jgi:hypothetical protein